MAMLAQLALTIAILSLRHPIAAAFVDDVHVRQHVVELLPYTTSYSFLATSVSGFSQQILFALGVRLRFPATLNFVAFFVVGLPLGALLAYPGGLAERGLWLGLNVAMLLALCGQYAYLTSIDWQQAATKARERALGDAGTTTEGSGGAESDGRGLAAADAASAQVAV